LIRLRIARGRIESEIQIWRHSHDMFALDIWGPIRGARRETSKEPVDVLYRTYVHLHVNS
jgi:hypothetical protein